ncbi:hypothetical protein BDV27DRAFT_160642 [Aspergillus caelatus]|uniref:Uncharacterized protein n=1 Tax=Aspergillus caelatus TaxID=61420 RepID=A0A5N6ZX53_9EURO|nr:uncharacterized protein BDV27DRAFT_160642 [Aspergillus caelatus]KAE8361499.1 hypothetical protein BDV27DRAFT_160642 [Aspergillus caelatus]
MELGSPLYLQAPPEDDRVASADALEQMNGPFTGPNIVPLKPLPLDTLPFQYNFGYAPDGICRYARSPRKILEEPQEQQFHDPSTQASITVCPPGFGLLPPQTGVSQYSLAPTSPEFRLLSFGSISLNVRVTWPSIYHDHINQYDIESSANTNGLEVYRENSIGHLQPQDPELMNPTCEEDSLLAYIQSVHMELASVRTEVTELRAGIELLNANRSVAPDMSINQVLSDLLSVDAGK